MHLSGKKIGKIIQSVLYLFSLFVMIYVGYIRENNSEWPYKQLNHDYFLNEKLEYPVNVQSPFLWLEKFENSYVFSEFQESKIYSEIQTIKESNKDSIQIYGLYNENPILSFTNNFENYMFTDRKSLE